MQTRTSLALVASALGAAALLVPVTPLSAFADGHRPAHRRPGHVHAASPASAYHPPATSGTSQPHEAIIPRLDPTIGGAGAFAGWQDMTDRTEINYEEAASIYLDPGNYPTGTIFFVRTVAEYGPGSSGCLRLYDATTQQPVVGMSTCNSNSSGTARRRFQEDSAPLQLPAGEHAYIVQGRATSSSQGDFVSLRSAEIIARWQE